MTENIQQKQVEVANTKDKKPNDTGSISVEGFVKIFDPSTKQVFVEKRA
jgi:hypothetical protein